MCDQRISKLQKTLQPFTAKVPIIVLQRVEERFPAVRKILNCGSVLKSSPSSADFCKSSHNNRDEVAIKVEEDSCKAGEDVKPILSQLIEIDSVECVNLPRSGRVLSGETCVRSCDGGNQVLGEKSNEFTDIKYKDRPEPIIFRPIKTEPEGMANDEVCARSEQHPFSCYVCNKVFLQKSDLVIHRRVHIGERQFFCGVCKKSFSEQRTLKKHKRIHSGEKPFACDVCNRTFGEKRNLIRHMRFHTGERPFSCDKCNKAFRGYSNLWRHKCICIGECKFSCDVCNKTFAQKSELRKHMVIHTGEQLFSCDICDKTYITRNHLKKDIGGYMDNCYFRVMCVVRHLEYVAI